MVVTFLRRAYMASSLNAGYDSHVSAEKRFEVLRRRHDWLENLFVLAGVLVTWVILIGVLKPHSKRMSFAQHRYRIFLQFSTFVAVASIVTLINLKIRMSNG